MTVSLILNVVLGSAVFAALVGLLVWGIASERRSSTGANARTRKPGELKPSHAPLASPAPVGASGRRETTHVLPAPHRGQPTPSAAQRAAVEA
jgi:hypothetical protein